MTDQLGHTLGSNGIPMMPYTATALLTRSLVMPVEDGSAEDRFDASLSSIQGEVEAAMQDEALGVEC